MAGGYSALVIFVVLGFKSGETYTSNATGTVVLHDTFSSGQLNTAQWDQFVTCWGGGNGEFQMYTPEAENTYIKDGVLHLRPTFTVDRFGEHFLESGTLNVENQWGKCSMYEESGNERHGRDIPPIMSARLSTKAGIKYGRVEVEAKLPKGDWLWPAIWLLPTGWKYGAWPRSGEIDMVEARGNVDLKDWEGYLQGLSAIYSTIHYGPAWNQKQSPGHWKIACPGTWGDEFHTYALDWTADQIRLEVDGEPIFHQNTPPGGYWNGFQGENIWSEGQRDAPFDQEFSLIMNVAVGGKFFQEEFTNKDYPQPWTRYSSHADQMASFWANRDKWGKTWNGEDAAMKIRSVKMIQY